MDSYKHLSLAVGPLKVESELWVTWGSFRLNGIKKKINEILSAIKLFHFR